VEYFFFAFFIAIIVSGFVVGSLFKKPQKPVTFEDYLYSIITEEEKPLSEIKNEIKTKFSHRVYPRLIVLVLAEFEKENRVFARFDDVKNEWVYQLNNEVKP